jgi:ferritin-like protein
VRNHFSGGILTMRIPDLDVDEDDDLEGSNSLHAGDYAPYPNKTVSSNYQLIALWRR